MKILDIKQRTPEWISLKREAISATDTAVIMGLSPWKSPLQLYEEKKFGKLQQTNWAMDKGNRLEDSARKWFENYSGHIMHDLVVQSDDYPWMIASLDGISEDGKILCELKCPGEKVHNDAKNGIVPKYYLPQLQKQMYVTGCSHCHYVSFDGEDGIVIVVPRDEEFIKKMIAKELEFFYMLKNDIPPEACDMDFMYRPDDKWHETAQMWKLAKKRLKQVEEQEEEYREELIKLSRGYNCVGGGVKLQQVTKKGSIDYKSIAELDGVDLEKYRKPMNKYYLIKEIA